MLQCLFNSLEQKPRTNLEQLPFFFFYNNNDLEFPDKELGSQAIETALTACAELV